MFYAHASAVEIAAHVLIAYLFIWTGIYNVTNPDRQKRNRDQIASHGIPAPGALLWAGYVTQWIGGVMVAIDLYTPYAALALILFVVLAEVLFHNYWKMTDPLRRMYHRLLFLNNCAVAGGLLLLAAPLLGGGAHVL